LLPILGKIGMKPTIQKKPKVEASASKPAKARKRAHFRYKVDPRLFTLDVHLIDGPMTEAFVKKNKKVIRRIEMRGDQTLAELHEAIYAAFDRDDPHMFEFQVGGKAPMDDDAHRYVLPFALEDKFFEDQIRRDLTMTTVGSLDLKAGDSFFYWFDFGDDWWHKIKIAAVVDESGPERDYPKIIARTGDSPPQYVDWEQEG
jgi:hypothetical protein